MYQLFAKVLNLLPACLLVISISANNSFLALETSLSYVWCTSLSSFCIQSSCPTPGTNADFAVLASIWHGFGIANPTSVPRGITGGAAPGANLRDGAGSRDGKNWLL